LGVLLQLYKPQIEREKRWMSNNKEKIYIKDHEASILKCTTKIKKIIT
jgi:hypothetical protein